MVATLGIPAVDEVASFGSLAVAFLGLRAHWVPAQRNPVCSQHGLPVQQEKLPPGFVHDDAIHTDDAATAWHRNRVGGWGRVAPCARRTTAKVSEASGFPNPQTPALFLHYTQSCDAQISHSAPGTL